jgi:Fe2+ transport system protein B
MFDEARKKGMEIDIDGLSRELGVEAYPLIAVEGTGSVSCSTLP